MCIVVLFKWWKNQKQIVNCFTRIRWLTNATSSYSFHDTIHNPKEYCLGLVTIVLVVSFVIILQVWMIDINECVSNSVLYAVARFWLSESQKDRQERVICYYFQIMIWVAAHTHWTMYLERDEWTLFLDSVWKSIRKWSGGCYGSSLVYDWKEL